MHVIDRGFKKKFPQTANNLPKIAFSHMRGGLAGRRRMAGKFFLKRLRELAGNLTANPAAAPIGDDRAAAAPRTCPDNGRMVLKVPRRRCAALMAVALADRT